MKDKMLAISNILKERFPQLTVQEVITLTWAILEAAIPEQLNQNKN